MEKIRILGIAPYEGIQALMLQAAKQFENIDLHVHVGDLEAGVRIANKYKEEDFDVIISRGGTAEMIRRESALPVVEIPLSVYDILRSMKLAENYHSKYAMIGFPAITRNAHFLCDVLRYDIDIHTIRNEGEARDLLRALSHSGVGMVLCDMITYSLAQRFGIPAILIASGAESVGTALEQALQISEAYRRQRGQSTFLRALLEEQKEALRAFAPGGALAYASPHPLPAALIEKISATLPQVLADGRRKFSFEAEGALFSVTARLRAIGDESFAIFRIRQRKASLSLQKHGIQFVTKEEAFDKFFNSFYGITQSSSPSNMTVEQYADSPQPLMIIGEIGTGKGQMARLLYGKSALAASSMVSVDCARLLDRGWDFFIESEHSPLCGRDAVIHIYHTKTLSEERFLALCNVIKDLDAHRRNRLLFSHSYSEAEGLTDRCRHLINFFACHTLFMPPLRSHKQDIPSLASLYISTLNIRLAREIIGFDPEALAALEAYDWPGNYDQFRRVMQELVMASSPPYIPLSAVHRALRQEASILYAPPGSGIDLHRTLEEINLDILQRVLAEEKGNQSATARRLGISRTTLWRMAQKLPGGL